MAGRFVEDHDGRVLQQHARDRQALLLATRQAVAALADDGVETVGQFIDHIEDASSLARRHELIVGCVRVRVTQVGAHRVVEHVRVLVDHTDRAPEAFLGDGADVVPIDTERTASYVIEARHEVEQRRFAGSRRPDDSDELTGLDVEVDALEYFAFFICSRAIGWPGRGRNDPGCHVAPSAARRLAGVAVLE